jgi:predicted polyphosphate/ATP-dependent NAD kinase
MPRRRLGLIVNPIAGLGGRVGLKGSDGPEIQRRARSLGAEPRAGDRAAAALGPLRSMAEAIDLLTAVGEMGETIALRAGFQPRVIPTCASRGAGATTAEDTCRAARAMRDAGADLVLFAGGDGTARDMCRAVGIGLPVLGIPAGVKIHSAVYAVTPILAGSLAAEFLGGGRAHLREAEVVDLDEEWFRRGQIVTALHGYLMVPHRAGLVQDRKAPTPPGVTAQTQAIAAAVAEQLKPGRAYALGPGTTTRAVAEYLGLSKTLVGVDLITREELLAADVGEREILEMQQRRPLGIIISPIGGQGFLLGRGNQQISPRVLRGIQREHLLVICPPAKLAALQSRPLLVDTGDPEVDGRLAGHLEVITGYRERAVYPVSSGGGVDDNSPGAEA